MTDQKLKSKILITGHRGYIGSVLLPYLKSNHADKYNLIGCDNEFFIDNLTAPSDWQETLIPQLNVHDIRDIKVEDLKGVDAIIHLAAVSNDPIGNLFGDATVSINKEGTVRLAKLAKSAGVKTFVLASSCSVYGAGGDEIVDENGKIAPLTTYAKSKIESEGALQGLASSSFQVTCLRFGTACGYSPRTRLDLVVNDFVASALSTQEIYLLSAGNAWRPFIHVEDMCRAMTWALSRTGKNIEIVNVGSDEMTLKIKDLAHLSARIIAGTQVKFANDASPDNRTYRVSFERFKRLAPEFQPHWSMADVIGDLHSNLSKLNQSYDNFRGGNLMRLNQLNVLLEKKVISKNLIRQDKLA